MEELTLLMLREQVWVAEKKNRLLFAESTKGGSQRAGRGNPPPFRQLFLHGVPVARGVSGSQTALPLLSSHVEMD